MARMIIGVTAGDAWDLFRPLFHALEEVLPVTFVNSADETPNRFSAWLLLGMPLHEVARTHGKPTFVAPAADGERWRGGGAEIHFGQQPLLDECLRGQALADAEDEATTPIAVQPGDQILASRAGQALWVDRPVHDGAALHLVALGPPTLAPGAALRAVFNGRRFLRLLPLLHFLKTLTRDVDWDEPPLRACFVFDDPNLRSTSYGYLDYPALAAHARVHRYHAAIATIPLDAGSVDGAVSTLFREPETQLSLLIHGNNHTRQELAAPRSPGASLALLAQALRRVRAFEDRHGLTVCRVMEPPFGVVDQDLLEPLYRLGYEAVLLDTKQFLQCNEHKPAMPFGGLSIADWPAGGLCCIPRIRVDSSWWKNEVVLAAVLRLPIVVVGHHYDAANSLRLLADIAETVNRLGDVQWSNLTDIARASYRQRLDGDCLHVLMRSRRVDVLVPPGVHSVEVARPWMGNRLERLLIAGDQETELFAGAVSEPIPVGESSRLTIESVDPNAIDPFDVSEPGRALWPRARRFLTETRDRLYPLVRRTGR